MCKKAHMTNIRDAIADIEARAKAAGVPIRRLCQVAGIAPSNWNRWKTEQTSPSFATWSRIESAVQELLRERAA